MDVVIWISMVIGLFCSILYIVSLHKDLTTANAEQQRLAEMVDNYKWAIEDSEGKYTNLANSLQKELLKLEEQVDNFKRERDPNSRFPSMEGTIQEANAIANLRMLQRLKKDLA